MTGEMDARDFKEFIRLGQFEKIERARVTGEVSFRGEEIPRNLRLLYVTFLGPVDFGDARISGSLDLTGCWFGRTLSLSNAMIDGELILDDVVVESTAQNGKAGDYDRAVVGTALDASGLRVTGRLSGAFLSVVGFADFSHARIDANAAFLAFEIRRSFAMSGLTVGGDLHLTAGYRSGATTKGFVAGNLDAANVSVRGNVFIAGVHINGNLNLWSADISGNFWLTPAVFKGSEAVASVVRGDMHLGASTVRGHVQFESVQIDGVLKLYSVDIGPLRIKHANDADAGPLGRRGCRLGGMWALGARIRGDALLYNLEVSGFGVGGERAVDLSQATIEGNLRLWAPGQFLEEGMRVTNGADMPEDRQSLIVGDIDLSGCSIGGDCNLTNLQVDGAVLLDDAEVTGDVLFQSAVSLLDSLQTQERHRDLYNRLVQHALEDRTGKPMARVRRLSMVMLRCHNDVDLSGLTLRATEAEVRSHSGYGTIDAHDITVAGHLWQYRTVGHQRWQQIAGGDVGIRPPNSDAQIPGSADFSGSKVWHMCLSGASFQTPVTRREDAETVERERGLILAGAKINELEITPLSSRHIFPIPINLADTAVTLWNLHDADDNRFTRYKSLLESDATFRRSTYLAAESSLRNRGHEAEADAIYREMVRRGHRERVRRRFWPSLLEITMVGVPAMLISMTLQLDLLVILATILIAALLSRPLVAFVRWLLWDWLLGFGTRPIRIGVVILIFLIISFAAVYLDSRNIGPTIGAEVATPDSPSYPQRWDLWDGAAIALRVHVPLANWGVRDDWQLADAPERSLYFAQTRVEGVRPEDYGMLMMILNFLAWPPFLAFALRRAFRFAS